MQTTQTYKPDNALHLLLVGEPFTGKTNLAMQFPDPYILDADGKMENATRRLPANKPFYWDRVTVYDTDTKNPDVPAGMHGKEVPMSERWSWGTKCALKAASSPLPKTLFIDSLSQMSIYLIAHILSKPMDKGALLIAGDRAMSQSEWNPFQMLMTKFIMTLKSAVASEEAAKVATDLLFKIVEQLEFAGLVYETWPPSWKP